MPKSKSIRKYSADELKAMIARGEDKSDIARVQSMSRDDLEAAIASDPDSNLEVDWSELTVTTPRNKQAVYMRLDLDILEYFKAQGSGYQTRINAVLRSYVDQVAGNAQPKK